MRPKQFVNVSDSDSSDAPPLKVLATYQCEEFNVALADYNVGFRQGWHFHERPVLIMILAGHTREQVGKEDVIANPLDIGIKQAEIRHTDHFWPRQVRIVRVELAHSLFNELEEKTPTVRTAKWVSESPAVRPLLRVSAGLGRHDRKYYSIRDDIYEALAGLSVPVPIRTASPAPAWLRLARAHLDEAYASGIRLTELAREAGVHPVYFARQFRRFFGCNVGQYVKSQQLRTAASLLALPESRLAHIACEVGCADQSHLTRIFASSFGLTPGKFRRLVR